MRGQVVAAVSHVVDASVSSGLAGGAGLVAVAAVVVGIVGLVFGLMRHHRKSVAKRATERAETAMSAVTTASSKRASTSS
jgi:hypothetical protein